VERATYRQTQCTLRASLLELCASIIYSLVGTLNNQLTGAVVVSGNHHAVNLCAYLLNNGIVKV
jgi:hypothetical protein